MDTMRFCVLFINLTHWREVPVKFVYPLRKFAYSKETLNIMEVVTIPRCMSTFLGRFLTSRGICVYFCVAGGSLVCYYLITGRRVLCWSGLVEVLFSVCV